MSYWTEKIIDELTLRYFCQGGTEPKRLEPHMRHKRDAIAAACSQDLTNIHEKAFNAEPLTYPTIHTGDGDVYNERVIEIIFPDGAHWHESKGWIETPTTIK